MMLFAPSVDAPDADRRRVGRSLGTVRQAPAKTAAAHSEQRAAQQNTLGNQALLRLMGSASGAPVLRRQPAGGGTASHPWDTTMLDATIEDRNNQQCLGTVNICGGLRFSKNCGKVTGPFCQPAGVDFGVDFFVDSINGARPGGFTPPTVRVQLIFVDANGGVTQNIDKTDPKPRYVAAGSPLEPSFGHDFPFATPVDGTLHIHLHLADPDSGAAADYADAVSFTVVPCA
jgi:hypothetical protein